MQLFESQGYVIPVAETTHQTGSSMHAAPAAAVLYIVIADCGVRPVRVAVIQRDGTNAEANLRLPTGLLSGDFGVASAAARSFITCYFIVSSLSG